MFGTTPFTTYLFIYILEPEAAGRGGIDIRHEHCSPGRREGLGHRSADTGSRAGHQGRPPVQAESGG